MDGPEGRKTCIYNGFTAFTKSNLNFLKPYKYESWWKELELFIMVGKWNPLVHYNNLPLIFQDFFWNSSAQEYLINAKYDINTHGRIFSKVNKPTGLF